MAEGELAAHPAPLPGDVNSQFTTPDGEEQIWAKPWCDLLVKSRRAVLWVSDPTSPVHIGVSAGDVWAALVPYSIPVSADFLHPCQCDGYVYTCICILHVQTKLQSSPSLRIATCWGALGLKGSWCTGVTRGRAIGVAGRGVSSSSCCFTLALAQLSPSSLLSVLWLAVPMSLCSTKGNILLEPLEFPSLLPF